MSWGSVIVGALAILAVIAIACVGVGMIIKTAGKAKRTFRRW